MMLLDMENFKINIEIVINMIFGKLQRIVLQHIYTHERQSSCQHNSTYLVPRQHKWSAQMVIQYGKTENNTKNIIDLGR